MDERRLSVVGAAAAVKWIAIAVAVVVVATLFAVASISIFATEQGQSAIVQILAYSLPITLGLLSGGLFKMAVAVDGKLSLLLQAKESTARAEGLIKGMQINPKVNIDDTDIDAEAQS